MKFSDQTRRILVIDDNEKIHNDIKEILCPKISSCSSKKNQAKAALFGDNETNTFVMPEYIIDSAFQGQDGLEQLKKSLSENKPYSLAFVDMRMPPGWDGLETIQHLWQHDSRLQVVICTAYSDYSWQETISKLGQNDRLLILKKPFDPTEIRQIALALTEKWFVVNHLDSMVKERTEQISRTQDAAVFALANLAESRDPETGEHLIRLRSYCDIIARQLRDNSEYSDQIDDLFLDNLYRSTPLHDIGKVGIPDSILLKPGGLTDHEFNLMKEHVIIGAKALEKTIRNEKSSESFLKMAVDIARYHHERYNGQGYMAGLQGNEIPLAARITALADVFDALTSVRVYKAAFQPEVAKSMINEESGKHFDPVIVTAFLDSYEHLYKIAVEDVKETEIQLA